jgi:hypothetical protein
MSVPNLKAIVQQVRNSRAWDFTMKAGLCAYSNAVVVALHAADPRFIHLGKTASQNHCVDPLGRRHAVDAALFVETGQAMDFIENASFGLLRPANNVTWGTKDPVGKYPPDRGFVPVGEVPPPPEEEPELPPDPIPPPPSDLGTQMRLNAINLELEALHDLLESQALQIRELETKFHVQHGHTHSARVGFFTVVTGPPR